MGEHEKQYFLRASLKSVMVNVFLQIGHIFSLFIISPLMIINKGNLMLEASFSHELITLMLLSYLVGHPGVEPGTRNL